VLDLALGEKLVERCGAWFSYADMRLGQGRENARRFLKENADVLEEIKSKILAARGLVTPDTISENGQE
jgi:recombination protein RecA